MSFMHIALHIWILLMLPDLTLVFLWPLGKFSNRWSVYSTWGERFACVYTSLLPFYGHTKYTAALGRHRSWMWIWYSNQGSNPTQAQLIINNIFYVLAAAGGRGWSKTSQWRHCLALRSSLVSQRAPKSHIPTTEVSCLKREIFHGRVWFKCLGVVFLKEPTVLLQIVSTSPPSTRQLWETFLLWVSSVPVKSLRIAARKIFLSHKYSSEKL